MDVVVAEQEDEKEVRNLAVEDMESSCENLHKVPVEVDCILVEVSLRFCQWVGFGTFKEGHTWRCAVGRIASLRMGIGHCRLCQVSVLEMILQRLRETQELDTRSMVQVLFTINQRLWNAESRWGSAVHAQG